MGSWIEAWAEPLALAVLAILLALLGHWILFAILRRLAPRTPGVIAGSLVRHARRPARLILVIFILILLVPGLDLPEQASFTIMRLLSFALIVGGGWLAANLLKSIRDVVTTRYDLSAADNLRAREVHTRARLIQRILTVLVVLVTASFILMSIPSIREIGVALFASAGIAGIVAGLAARPVLSNLLAGVQLAFTQPIRLDDVVIVEGEWGWIEEIRMTFVVVRIWDLRRLVVPLTYFIENPFQNWTRTSADILGTVFLYTDYSVPVGAVRDELHRILQTSPLWDGSVWNLQVTNATEKTMELRALMGARNSGQAWELRCFVREKLIDYVQREYPQSLPRLRTGLDPIAPVAAG